MYWASGQVGTPAEDMAISAVGKLNGFFEDIKNTLPEAVVIAVDGLVDFIDPVTGQLQSTFDTAGGAGHQGLAGIAGPEYAAPVGAVVNWLTNGIANGHRVRGKTFLVPLARSNFDGQGNLASNSVTVLQTAANGLVSAGGGSAQMLVWHRPVKANAQAVPPRVAAPGAQFDVISAKVPDFAAVLRSRRD